MEDYSFPEKKIHKLITTIICVFQNNTLPLLKYNELFKRQCHINIRKIDHFVYFESLKKIFAVVMTFQNLLLLLWITSLIGHDKKISFFF